MAARMMKRALFVLLAMPFAALALTDPTAPPAAQGAGVDGMAAPAIPLTAIKRVGGRRIAVIGGQEIAVGGRYQDARVLRISESEVVLRQGSETTVLRLHPQAEKRSRGK